MANKTYQELVGNYKNVRHTIQKLPHPKERLEAIINAISEFSENIDELTAEERDKLKLHHQLSTELYKYSLEMRWAEDL